MDEQPIWKVLYDSPFEREEFADILVSHLAALIREGVVKLEDFETFVDDSD